MLVVRGNKRNYIFLYYKVNNILSKQHENNFTEIKHILVENDHPAKILPRQMQEIFT